MSAFPLLTCHRQNSRLATPARDVTTNQRRRRRRRRRRKARSAFGCAENGAFLPPSLRDHSHSSQTLCLSAQVKLGPPPLLPAQRVRQKGGKRKRVPLLLLLLLLLWSTYHFLHFLENVGRGGGGGGGGGGARAHALALGLRPRGFLSHRASKVFLVLSP